MDLDNATPSGEGEGTSTSNFEVPKEALEGALNPLREAARLLSAQRKPKEKAPSETNEAARAAPAEQPPQESEAKAEDAAPPEEVPGETQEAEPETVPPIEPPRSWTKEAREHWQTLPRPTQEYLAEREQERDRAVRQSQNEAAEKLKGLSAKEQALEVQRQQYEQALPVLLQNLQSGMASDFADIRSMADVQKMANEDWPRYVRWDAAQKQAAAVQQEMVAGQQRHQQEYSQKWGEYVSREDKLFNEKVPEMADAKKAAELRDAAIKVLEDVGFTQNELAANWHENPLFRDHRMQLLIRDAVNWRGAQAKAKTLTAKPLPKVQQPGTARGGRNETDAQRIQVLNQQLDNASGMNALRIAADLRRLQAGR